jgi:hypothetical protein
MSTEKRYVAHRVEIRMAGTAKQNLDLDVVFFRIAPRGRRDE